jgi:adenine phosphoribosyltransferase
MSAALPPYLRLVDTQTGGRRCDVTPLFADPVAFDVLLTNLAAPFVAAPPQLVAGIDALGFVLGTGLALRFSCGFVPVRKGGKLPSRADRRTCIDYTGEEKTLELRLDAIPPGAHVLLVDEWVETGAQMITAAALIEAQGGVISGLATIQMDDNDQTRHLRARYHCHMLTSAL